jgi:hypothetical protein
MTLIEIDNWNPVPLVKTRTWYSGTLDEALQKFKAIYGYDCKVVFHLRDQWICVVDKDYEVKNGK